MENFCYIACLQKAREKQRKAVVEDEVLPLSTKNEVCVTSGVRSCMCVCVLGRVHAYVHTYMHPWVRAYFHVKFAIECIAGLLSMVLLNHGFLFLFLLGLSV